jgi:hypothetical protein
VRLAVRTLVSGPSDMLATVMSELNPPFLFVDGNCRYWARGGSGGISDRWYPIREGVLDARTELELARAMHYEQWPQLEGGFGTIVNDHPVAVVFHNRDHSFACADPCRTPKANDGASAFAHVRQVFEAHSSWIERLYSTGTESRGSVRVALWAQRDSQLAGVQRLAWPGPQSVSSVAKMLPDKGVLPGTSLRIDDQTTVSALREFRRLLLSGQLGSTYGPIAIENDEAPFTPFILYFRDAIGELEGDVGLIPIP